MSRSEHLAEGHKQALALHSILPQLDWAPVSPITTEKTFLRFSHLSYQTQSFDEIWKELYTFWFGDAFPLWKQLPTVYFVALGNLSWYFNLLKRLNTKQLRMNLFVGVSRVCSAHMNKSWTNACCFSLSPHGFVNPFLQCLNRPVPDMTSLPIIVKPPKKPGGQVAIMSRYSLACSWALNLAPPPPTLEVSKLFCFLLSTWIHFQDPASLW